MIGRGGFGAVYEATNRASKEIVALKVVSTRDSDVLFEIDLLKAVNNQCANIVTYLYVFTVWFSALLDKNVAGVI